MLLEQFSYLITGPERLTKITLQKDRYWSRCSALANHSGLRFKNILPLR